MDFHYEIKNKKIKVMVEKKAEELRITTDELILSYIRRGLMNDSFSDEVFGELHSDKYMCEVNEALNLDWSEGTVKKNVGKTTEKLKIGDSHFF